MRDHGYDDIIKNDVSVSFGRGEDDMARSLRLLLKKKDTFLNRIQLSIPTLRAFVRERVEAGDEFPMDLFGAYVGNVQL